MNITLFPKVKIERNTAFERFLITGNVVHAPEQGNIVHPPPEQNNVNAFNGPEHGNIVHPPPEQDNVNAVNGPEQGNIVHRPPEQENVVRRPPEQRNVVFHPVNMANIPFGARGRKRGPDSHQMSQQSSSVMTNKMARVPAREPLFIIAPQPAKRTYNRTISTPLANIRSNHRARGVSYPLPDELDELLVLPNNNADDTLENFQFDENFGTLHYDSSSNEEY